MRVPLARPTFDAADEQALIEVLRSGWVGAGPRLSEFEQSFARYTEGRFAIGVSSCTAALHMTLLALDLQPDDEVLVPAFTWISTPNAVELAGARTVFCDIDPATYNIDVRDAECRITSHTRAILPVHLFGLAADMDSVCALAEANRLTVVEDAACALGTLYRGRHVGTFGDAACFSFHPRKSITTGEGGMVLTADAAFQSRIRSLRDIGADRESLSPDDAAKQLMPDFPNLGFNYRLTDLQAALGLTQLAKFDDILAQRRVAAARYDEMLSGNAFADWLCLPGGDGHAYQAYVCSLAPRPIDEDAVRELNAKRNELMKRLFQSGVATRPGTHAPHMLGYYRRKYEIAPSHLWHSWLADQLTVALPLYAGITVTEQEYVCDALRREWDLTK